MLYLTDQRQLTFRFPDVHEEAKLTIELQRTLRVPDDGKDYPQPAGLGTFPVRHVNDFAGLLPNSWLGRGGLMVPMYQSEAFWLKFTSTRIPDRASYPFAVKIGAGKINAVTGAGWDAKLNREPQDYVVTPRQKWLDGFVVGDGIVRQFVAMPLGRGYTVEEQVTRCAEYGGVQLQAYPMKREAFDQRFPVQEPVRFSIAGGSGFDDFDYNLAEPKAARPVKRRRSKPAMGVAPSGLIRQQVFKDAYNAEDWDPDQTSRCFIHLCNSAQWQALTQEKPPTRPISQKEYRKAGLPWFKHYAEKARTLTGSATLAGLETVADHAQTVGDPPPKDNESQVGISLFDLPDSEARCPDERAQ